HSSFQGKKGDIHLLSYDLAQKMNVPLCCPSILPETRDAHPPAPGGEPHFDCRSRSRRLVPGVNFAFSVDALWYLSGRPSAYSSSILGPSRVFLPVGLPQWTSTRYSLPGLGPRWAGMENFPFAIASPDVRAFSSRGISAKLPIPMGLPSTITV